MRKNYMWWIVAGVPAIGVAAWGPIVSNVEQAKYAIIESYGDIEIRDYPPMNVAEAEVSGEREKAIGQGFRMIADYILAIILPRRR